MPITPAEEFVKGQARILSNTTYLLAANIIQKFISLGFFVYYVRILGPNGTGIFEPVRSVIPIALTVIDFSLSAVLTREIARAPNRALEYTNNVLSIKILIALAAFIIALAVNAAASFNQLTRTLLFLVGVIVSLDMFTMTYTAVLRGLQVFRYEAIGIVLTSLTSVTTGVIAFKLNVGIPGLMIAFVAGSIVNLAFMLTMVRRKLGTFPRLSWHTPVIRQFTSIALPIVIAALLAKLFTYSDRFLLLRYAGETAVGIYAVANKVPFALEFIAATFAASLLPAMSHLFIRSRDQLGHVFEQALRYLLILSIPLAVGVFVLAHPFAVKLFGRQFADATVPLRIMICALPLIFLNFPVGSFLIATNRQVWNSINLGIAVTVSIVLNILLIPRYGVTGSAIAVLSSYSVLFTLGIIQARRVTTINGGRIMRVLGKVLVSSAIMAVPLYLLNRTFSPYFLSIPAGMLYVAAMFIFGELKTKDLRIIFRALGRKST